MRKEAFEPTGLIPRSIIRTFDRFLQQLLPGSEGIAIQEYQVSRYQILVSIKSLFLLICTPLIVNFTIKSLLLTPLTEHLWNSRQDEIFLNAYQEKRAFAEMQDLSEKLFFESLTDTKLNTQSGQSISFDDGSANSFSFLQPTVWNRLQHRAQNENAGTGSIQSICYSPSCLRHAFALPGPPRPGRAGTSVPVPVSVPYFEWKDSFLPEYSFLSAQNFTQNVVQKENRLAHTSLENSRNELQEIFQKQLLEIAYQYNKQSILAITNLLGDFVTFFTLYLLLQFMQPQIIILKSFLTESIYSLSDTTKSFLLILVMDLLVGFHSPRGWEIALETLLRHLGLPEEENFILLFVALFPVFLDTVFKYWIFRFLNKISPSTVVTYHSMLE